MCPRPEPFDTSVNRALPSFKNNLLPVRTLVTYKSASPSLSTSANDAVTPVAPTTDTPAAAVMSSNRPPPTLRYSRLLPTWFEK